MRKFVLFFILAAVAPCFAIAEETQVVVTSTSGGRTEGVAPPVVTYDDVEGTLTVTLEAQALDAYVEVTSDAGGGTELATVVTATQAVLPLPPLDEGSHTVTVTVATGATFEGTLTAPAR